jgi:lipopolysaccharide export system protein LptC
VARLTGEKGANLSSIAKEQKATPGQIELVGARYEGVDDSGRPYVVTADRAVRDMTNAEALHFEKPTALMTLESGAVFGMKGESGFFDRAQQMLELDAGVTIDYSEGFSMTLKKVVVDLRAGTAKSEDPVVGTGALGAISAKNMTVTDGGDNVVFGGPATMKIALKGKSG